MTEYFVESWPPADPADRTRTDCRNWPEADALALGLARGGDNAVVLHVETSYMAVPVAVSERRRARHGLPGYLYALRLQDGGVMSWRGALPPSQPAGMGRGDPDGRPFLSPRLDG